jgi:predicted AlkP superfamily pyrophosphatase or phosphodiesterase
MKFKVTRNLKSPFLIVLLAIFFTFISKISEAKPAVVLISIDAFAQQYIDKYQPPNLIKLMQQGVYAKALLPVYPSKTFPNHLSIVTGVYTAKHSIIHNTFFRRDIQQQYHKGDGKKQSSWVTATPIWALAEQHGLTSAVYFWPESEVNIKSATPTYNYSYNSFTSNDARVKQIIRWLKMPEQTRPQFIASYFSLVDHAGHVFGPDSKAVELAVYKADKIVGELVQAINTEVKQPVNLIIVSDHGMQQIDKAHNIDWQQWLNNSDDFKVINGETQLLIYSANKAKLNKAYNLLSQQKDNRFNVYQQTEFPTHWHWQHNKNVLPDLVLDAKPPFVFDQYKALQNNGTHGYDPLNNKNMQAIFIASGPNFKQHTQIPAFENIHIFPMLEKLLGIKSNLPIDGQMSVLQPYLINVE